MKPIAALTLLFLCPSMQSQQTYVEIPFTFFANGGGVSQVAVPSYSGDETLRAVTVSIRMEVTRMAAIENLSDSPERFTIEYLGGGLLTRDPRLNAVHLVKHPKRKGTFAVDAYDGTLDWQGPSSVRWTQTHVHYIDFQVTEPAIVAEFVTATPENVFLRMEGEEPVLSTPDGTLHSFEEISLAVGVDCVVRYDHL